MPAAGSTAPHSFTLLSTARFKIVYFLTPFCAFFSFAIFVVIFALCLHGFEYGKKNKKAGSARVNGEGRLT